MALRKRGFPQERGGSKPGRNYDLFLIINKVYFASYADDNTIYVIINGVKEVIKSLKKTSDELF